MPVVERVYKVTNQGDLDKKVKEFEEKAKEKITKEGLEEMKAMNTALQETLLIAQMNEIISQIDRVEYEKRVQESYISYLENEHRDTSVKYMSGAEWEAQIELKKIQAAEKEQKEAPTKQTQHTNDFTRSNT